MSMWQYFEYKISHLIDVFCRHWFRFPNQRSCCHCCSSSGKFCILCMSWACPFWLKSICNFRGWLIMLSLALPWYIYQYYVNGTEFLSGFIIHHNIERFSRPFEGHSGNISYYIIVLIFSTLLLTRLVLPLFQWSKICSNKPLERFLWIWFLSVFFIFTRPNKATTLFIIWNDTDFYTFSNSFKAR